MYKLIGIFLIISFILPVHAEIITGEVEYRDENFQNSAIFNNDKIQSRLNDPYCIDNKLHILQGITELNDRKLAKFSDGSYGIQFYNDPLYSWYYSSEGKLISFIKKDTLSYPCKFTKYDSNGNIVNTGYRISEKESYIYSPDGKLLAHWIGNNCYDKNQNIIMTRKICN